MNNAQSASYFSPMNLGIYFVGYLVFGFCLWKIAERLGVKDSWLAWVPIANLYTFTQAAEVEWWYVILCFVPCVGFFVSIYLWWKICENLGKAGVLSLLMLIPCVNVIFLFWLALAE